MKSRSCYKIGGLDLVAKIFNYENTEKTIGMTLGREILLNTRSRIYDTVTYDDLSDIMKKRLKSVGLKDFTQDCLQYISLNIMVRTLD